MLIDFDELAQNQMILEIDTEYAVFSTSAQNHCMIIPFAEPFGSSPPNLISTTAGDSGDDLFIDFKTPAYELNFFVLGINTVGVAAKMRVFYGADQMAEEPLLTDKQYLLMPFLVDLSAFPGITRVEIVEVDDVMGFGYDDFSFVVY